MSASSSPGTSNRSHSVCCVNRVAPRADSSPTRYGLYFGLSRARARQLVDALRHRAARDQQGPGGVAEGVLHVPCGQPPRVHLGDQSLQDVGVALQERGYEGIT